MYVGVTRAENKLYLTTAKRRQMWGEYKYYTPSRFLEEIPANLIDEEASEYSEYSSERSTFRSAVKSVKDGGNTYKTSNTSFTPDGYVKPSNGFGSSFVAPSSKKLTSSSNGFGSNFTAPKINKTTASAYHRRGFDFASFLFNAILRIWIILSSDRNRRSRNRRSRL